MKKCYLLFLCLLSVASSFATHNKAGDITYKHISGLTYEFTITIFADGSSPAVGRKEIEIEWGDNTGKDSLRVISEDPIGPPGGNTIKRVWRGNHTFPGPGSYSVRVEDPNRNASVDNITNSVNVPFVIETLLRISPFLNQVNNSVILRNDPVDDACIGATYVYNPGAIDFDGDSIAYEIAESKGSGGAIAPGYEFPPASDSLKVNPITGDLVWEKPNFIGLYNVAIKIKEYRNGVLISEVLRDLQIEVFPGCNNQPPDIIADQLVCIDAGSVLQVPIQATDPDIQDRVTITATGEVLESPINTRTNFNSGVVGNPTNASFVWNTNCTDVRLNLYKLSVRAEDDADKRGVPSLVNFKTINIQVVAPAPINVTANDIGTSIELNWVNNSCQNALGYFVYRRLGFSGFSPDSCTTGVPEGIGYEKISTINGVVNTSFIDDNLGEGLIPGQQYCYLITKFFSDGSESYASDEVCAIVEKVVPVITIVSVQSTDINTGSLNLAWSPPDKLDTIAYPSPYRYLLYSIENESRVLFDSTNSINDTTYILQNRNTENQPFQFQVELFSLGNGRTLAGNSVRASSIFLSALGSNKKVELSWTTQVPWKNDSFIVYRRLPDSLNFDSIAVTSRSNYSDNDLINEKEYCYYIESIGKYNLSSVQNPLINLSQISCVAPLDTIAPCPPIPTSDASCERDQLVLIWNNPNNSCADDVEFYRIYRSETKDGSKVLIDQTNNAGDTVLNIDNQEIAGCYYVTAIDSAGNESDYSNSACVDFCPVYELPNVFTPNGDNKNDFFVPVKPYRYVDSIDLKIFNRWGELVFETYDPDIKWDGQRKNPIDFIDAKSSLEGVYFYVCIVYELSIEKKEPRVIKGTVTILDPQIINSK